MSRTHDNSCSTVCTDYDDHTDHCTLTHACWCPFGPLTFDQLAAILWTDAELAGLLATTDEQSPDYPRHGSRP